MAVNPVHVIDFSFLEEDDEIELPSQMRIRRPSAAWRSTTVPHLAATDVDFSVNENEDIPDNPYDPSFTVDLLFLDRHGPASGGRLGDICVTNRDAKEDAVLFASFAAVSATVYRTRASPCFPAGLSANPR